LEWKAEVLQQPSRPSFIHSRKRTSIQGDFGSVEFLPARALVCLREVTRLLVALDRLMRFPECCYGLPGICV
jgi:hypothetical protein